ncbi:MAG: DNA-processing protein DprA [Acidimicrobiia bacterium]
MAEGSEEPEAAWLVALLTLPGMGPARLRQQLAGRGPRAAWEEVAAGEGTGVAPELRRRWAVAARSVDVGGRWAAHEVAGVRVLLPGDDAWPTALVDDPEPPVALFSLGDPSVLRRPCVAVIGTRRCSAAGRSIAADLGADLAAAGVCVVSGLALGIDGAAHRGALDAGGGPAAVVGSGLDVVYPGRHRQLWGEVAARGVVLSEYPLGATPERWRFPARNRVIAGLASVVVVVESHAAGGSMHTVDAALERDRLVAVVPGPVRSPASAGTNGLLVSGATPVRDATDVLVALGLRTLTPGGRAVPSAQPAGDAGAVLDAVGWGPSTLEEVAARCEAPLGPVAVHLAALERDGWLTSGTGWYERVR